MRRLLIIVILLLALTPASLVLAIDSRIGVAHVAGTYPDRQAQKDFLLYGANDALNLGFRSIEVFLDPRVCRPRPLGGYQTLKYCKPEDTTLVRGDSLVALAKHPDYKTLLSLPFSRIHLTVDTINPAGIQQWEIGGPQTGGSEPALVSEAALAATRKDFYDLVVYLSNTYKNSGKTFILVNPSELDWHLVAPTGCRSHAYQGDDEACMNEPASSNAIANAISYLNAVADGVTQAKQDAPLTGMKLYHACEINMVIRRSLRGKQSALTDVLPNTHCEMAAYSAHEARREDLKTLSTTEVLRALNFIASRMPDHPELGNKNVMISEIGFSKNAAGTELTETQFREFYTNYLSDILSWGTPYVTIWQMYEYGNIIGIRDPNLRTTQTYSVLTSSFGSSPTSPQNKPGDLNNDSKVDIFDYNLLISTFGNPYTIYDYNTLIEHLGS